MKEYTYLSIVSIILTLVIDRITKINILQKGLYWLFLAIILFFKLLVNGYLTGTNIVIYNAKFFIGLRIGTIPVEDFMFGFSMVTITIIFWEYFLKKGEGL